MRISDITRNPAIKEALKSGKVYHTEGDPRYVLRVAEDITVYKRVAAFSYRNYTRLETRVIELLLPKGAIVCIGTRSGGSHPGKCRANKAISKGSGFSMHTARSYKPPFQYRKDSWVLPDKFEVSIQACSGGIHFFFSKQQAQDFFM